MKTQIRAHTSLLKSAVRRSGFALASLGLLAMTAQAQVTLTNSDAVGVSSYNSIGNWNSGAAPSAGNNYFTSTNGLRTPADGNDYVFQGGSLTLQSSSAYSFLFKGSSYRTYTINNLTNNGGLLRSGSSSVDTCVIGGNGMVLTGGTTNTVQADQSPFILTAPLTGPGGLTVAGTYTTSVNSSNSYAGATTVNGGILQLGSQTAPSTNFLPYVPTLYLSFDSTNGSGIVTNLGSGGTTFNGTLTGNAAIVPGGRYGKALSCTVTNDYVAIASSVGLFSCNSNWTWAMWIKTTTSGATLMYQGTATWGANMSTFYLNNGTGGGTKLGGVRWGQGWMEGTATLNDGKWHHVAMTCTSSGTKAMYVDGAVDAVALNGWGTSAGAGTLLRIGGSGATTEGDGHAGLGGLIDEVVVFTNALTQAQIQALMDVGGSGTPQLPGGSAVTVASGAKLDLNGFNQTVAGLSGGGTVDSTLAYRAPVLTISNNGSSYFSGSINNTGGTVANNMLLSLTMTGGGTQILAGANTFPGGINVVQGTLAVTNGGSLVVSSNNADNITVGSVNGQAGALYQYAGATITTTNNSLGDFQIGSTAGAYGYYNLSGGTVTLANTNLGAEIDIGGSGGGAGTFGQMDMSGGTFNLPNIPTTYFLENRGAVGESSVFNMSGGTVQILNSTNPPSGNLTGLAISWAAGSQTNVTTISGTAQFLTPSLTVKLNEGSAYNAQGNAGNLTTLNLNGGLLQTLGFLNGPLANNVGVNINFNGGTVKAGTAANPSFITNLAGIYVYPNGATIDDNGQAIAIGQPLLAPPGNGVGSIAVATGGAGYVTPPQVLISGGSGSNATAYATIAGGQVTGIVVTSPGRGYASAPTVTLAGGGYATTATAGTVTLAANGSGGLTKQGAGTLTLNGASTFTGNTLIKAGTLSLGSSATLASTNIVVTNGATFDVSAPANTVILAGQSVKNAGTVNGSLVITNGAAYYADLGAGYATNTVTTNLTLVTGSTTYFKLGTTYNGANDLLNVGGNLTDNGQISISAPSTSVNLDTNQDYVLIAAGSVSGSIPATPNWGVKPLNWINFSVIQSGTNLQLHYTPSTPPIVASLLFSPTNLVRNQSVLVSATITPGSGTVTSVNLDGSPIGLSSSIALTVSSTANVYTNTIVVPASTLAAPYTLIVTVSDSTPLTGTGSGGITVNASTEVWNGAGADAYWDDNNNWFSTFAPGYVGDSLIFAGTANLLPDMNQAYTVSSLTFSNNAGAFVIGSAESQTLTLSGSGVIANNSANPQTLTLAVGDSGGGLTKTGNGPLVLAGYNNYTGPTTVNAGSLVVSGTVNSTNLTVVGGAAGNTTLAVSGSLTHKLMLVGNASGSVAAVYQTNGTISATTATAIDNTSIGNATGAFGYYNLAAGATLSTAGLAVGGENASGTAFSGTGGSGIMDINGGTLSDGGWLVMSRGATNETGILNLYSGSVTFNGGGVSACWGTNQTAVINVLNGSLTCGGNVGINLNQYASAYNTGVLNLNGGLAQVNSLSGLYGQVNFNGGQLQAFVNNNPSFLTGLGSVTVYGGGATINDNGYNIGVNQALLAPSGNGVNAIASFTGGAGYIAPPIVTVVPGTGDTTGTGATALAQVDLGAGSSTLGQVTNVLITCPGVNYTATPTFVLTGGGCTTPATITGAAPTANTSGGFTKTGSGVLTLGGYSTYTGNTVVSNGTLQVADALVHLTFDDVSSTTVVNEGIGGTTYNGALTGTATISTGAGRFGNALSIPSGSATNAYVLISNAGTLLNGTSNSYWTVAMWVKTTTAGGVLLYQGAGAWGSGNTEFYLQNGTQADGTGTHFGGVRYAQGWVSGTATVNDGNWHLCALTCSNGVKTFYVDGGVDAILTGSTYWTGTAAGSQLRIGGATPGADSQVGLNGLIDEFYLYNRALNPAEIQSLYTRNSAGTPVVPATSTVNVTSGTTFNVGGLSQTVGALTGSGTVVLGNNAAAAGTLTIAPTGVDEFDGAISDSGAESVVMAGSGTLVLTGTETYPGLTTVSNGTLLVNGSLAGPATVAAGKLGGLGSVNGPVTVYGNLVPGSNSLTGTLTCGAGLTLASGGIASFSLSTSASGANDKVTVSGYLTNNNNFIHISAPSTTANLDTADYVLIDNSSGSGIVGNILSTPVWDVRPANYANYTVINNGSGQIVLHYSLATAPTATISLTPSTASRNQAVLVTVTVTPGSPGAVVNGDVTLDTSSLGGSPTLPLVPVGSTQVYTNTIAAPGNTAPGGYSLLATVTDSVAQTGTAVTTLTVTAASDVWNGASSADNLWDDNANWVNGAAPGFTGDSLTFAGTTRLTPSMDNNYSVTSVTFSNNAGSFNLGTANGSVLTNSGGFINNSANPQTVDVPVVETAVQTFNAAAGDIVVSNTITDNGYGLTKSGSHALTLAGTAHLTGPLLLDAGTVNLNGTVSASNAFAGAVSGKVVVNIPSGSSLAFSNLFVGNANGAVAAIYQTGGSVNAAGGFVGDMLCLGNITNSYGYYDAIGGTVSPNGICIGGENNPAGMPWPPTPAGNGVFDVNGGTVNDVGWLVLSRGSTTEVGVLNVTGGRLNYAGGGIVNCWGNNQTAIMNIQGGVVSNSIGVGIVVNNYNNTSDTGILNLNGGVVQATAVSGTPGQLNFNGGTLRASTNNANFITIGGTYVYGGGATLDNKGYAVTIPTPLLAPTGSGVTGIASFTGGSGYIAPPIVIITNAAGDTTGFGATAIAQINPASGTVTNVIITCPGQNYTATPMFVVSGGGATSPATITGAAVTANASGGLVATGSGRLTLAGANTYTGNTVISAGTLALASGGSIGNSANINVAGSATFDVSAAPFVLSSTQTLSGNGTVNGSVTNSGTIEAGSGSTIGTLTFNNNLTLSAGGSLAVKLNKSLTPGNTNDQVYCYGTLTYGGTLVVSNLGGTLNVGDSFPLFLTGGSTGNFTAVTGSPGTGLAYSFNPTSGVLSVVTGIASNPTNITATLTGSTLGLSWPADHLGWILQAQTNSLSTGLSANWYDVVGSSTLTNLNVTIDPAQPTVFYRLRHP